MLPALLSIHLDKPNKKPVRIWLPLFILWPLIALLLCIALPIALLVDLIGLLFLKFFICTRLIFATLGLLDALRGLQVNVEGKEERVFISVQ